LCIHAKTIFFRPKNREELFNLRHAQARNIVERIFGIVKRRWAVFSRAPEYPVETQAKLVPAIAALHNFLRVHDSDDNALDLGSTGEATSQGSMQREGSGSLEDFFNYEPREISPEELGISITAAERARASARRDRIAQRMWEDYLVVLRERGRVPDT
jgi:hypothetical protein